MGVLILLFIPVFVVVYTFVLVFQLAVRPVFLTRQLCYEVQHPDRLDLTARTRVSRMLDSLVGSPVLSGEWHAHSDDPVSRIWLARTANVIAPIRGPPLVRVHGRFDINPLIGRIDRGWHEPLGKLVPAYNRGPGRGDPKLSKGESDLPFLLDENLYVARAERFRTFNSPYKQLRIALIALLLGCFIEGQAFVQAVCLVCYVSGEFVLTDVLPIPLVLHTPLEIQGSPPFLHHPRC